MMGKCRYSPLWQKNPKYNWVGPVPGNDREVYCRICRKAFKLATMGLTALDSHMRSNKHVVMSKCCQQQGPIGHFCVPSGSSGVTPATDSTVAASATTTAATTSTAVVNRLASTSHQQPMNLQSFCGSTPTLRSEVIWVLKTMTDHHSYTSNMDIGDVFKTMFPDSQIASTFTCGKDKTSYIVNFGLAPFITTKLTEQINKSPCFTIMFDESLNKTTKNKQLDLHIRFWENDMVQSRYFGSEFMGHSKAEDLMKHFKECVRNLNMRQMLSVSMDGPSVNWRFFEMLQQEHAEQFAGAQLVMVGSCGLHTLHNAFKLGFVNWQMDKFLRALHTIFHNVPARREDFSKLTKSDDFALPFCGHRWIENLPVAERAYTIWPNIKKYVDSVEKKQLPNPGTSSFDTIQQATKDPLIPANCNFSWPYPELSHLFSQNLTPLQMVRLPVTDKQSWVHAKAVDIGIGAEAVIKELQRQCRSVGELTILQFRQDCIEGLSKSLKKIQEKSPLCFPAVRQLSCLNPAMMKSHPESCQEKMRCLVRKFLQDNQLAGSYAADDFVIQQFDSFLTQSATNQDVINFNPASDRLDTFLHSHTSQVYPELWAFCQKLLVLSHGQATVERGFSINKQVQVCNIQEDTVVAHRLVCDFVVRHGGVAKVPITQELLTLAAGARSKYRLHLESAKKKTEKEAQGQKRLAIEKELEELKKKKKKAIQEVSERLLLDADKLAEEAESIRSHEAQSSNRGPARPTNARGREAASEKHGGRDLKFALKVIK
ncbi:hypothetical protein WMY93_031716 [Mugilogobius chulae]|uniref:BED-type domain-containing protein n=1 Tax=Mugilogobius chulae TaxID=88201 RepID=A0AAW0MLG5_9GOBI